MFTAIIASADKARSPSPTRAPLAERWRQLSPARQTVLWLIAVLPLLWGGVAVTLDWVHARTVAEAEVETGNLVRVLSEEVNTAIRTVDLTLLDLREHWQQEPARFGQRVEARKVRLARDFAFDVTVTGADGVQAFSTNGGAAAPTLPVIGDTLAISGPVPQKNPNEWTIRFARPLVDDTGISQGTIVMSLQARYLARFCRGIDVGNRGVCVLMRDDGQMLDRAPLPPRPLHTIRLPIPALGQGGQDLLLESHAGRTDGVHRLYGWRHLPGFPLVVSVGTSQDVVMAPYQRLRTILISAGVGASLLLALAGWLRFAGVQQRRRAVATLAESEARWQYALEGARETVWDWDLSTGSVFLSARLADIIGVAVADLPTKMTAYAQLIHPEDMPLVLGSVREHLTGNATKYECEYRLHASDGSYRWVSARGTAISHDRNGRTLRMTGVLSDITEAHSAQEADRMYQLRYDTLTGLANRGMLREEGARMLEQAAARGERLWMVCVDMDRFQVLNDALGHEAGNVMLQVVARRLQSTLDSADMGARLDGDRFVMLLGGALDERAVANRAKAMRAAIAKPLSVEGNEYYLACSAGIAAFPDDGATIDVLLQHAEAAMRRVKAIGGNAFGFHEAAHNERAIDRLRIESALRHAVANGELMLHYQPQVLLRTGDVVGAEALLRWRHPELGMVPPDRFIPIAEETGLIRDIGRWVLREACRRARTWHDAGYPHLRIGVNLSSYQFHDPMLVDDIAAVLHETGVPGTLLDLEITEGVVMTNIDMAVKTMLRLKMLGATLSLDDFGTGYSSLSYLRRLPIDTLKIDKSFVSQVTSDTRLAAITTSIVAMAQSLDVAVIAEGVETAEQLDFMCQLRCDEIQGYYFSRPLTAGQFDTMLAEAHRLELESGEQEAAAV